MVVIKSINELSGVSFRADTPAGNVPGARTRQVCTTETREERKKAGLAEIGGEWWRKSEVGSQKSEVMGGRAWERGHGGGIGRLVAGGT